MTDKTPSEQLLEAFAHQQTAFGQAIMSEVRSSRRSANLRTALLILMAVGFLVFNYFAARGGAQIPSGASYASVVRITGAIESGSTASLKELENNLYRAFHDEESSGVLLVINSPGGTPVQANAIYEYLLELKQTTGKKLIVLGQDVVTSGAYMVASAADKIFVDPSTLIGSIGVIQQTFGIKGLAERFGVEARTIIAGEHKHRLDPFTDPTEDDLIKAQDVLDKIHQNFISVVEQGRGERLNGEKSKLFSGDYWVGLEGVELGLADGIGNYHGVLKSEFQSEHAVDYSVKPGFLAQFPNLTQVVISAIQGSITSYRL